MSMFSEIVTEGMVEAFVKELKKELQANQDNPEVCAVLRKVGRYALTLQEGSLPRWDQEYQGLFEEPKERDVTAQC